MTIEARFRMKRGDFLLDVDLSIPAEGITSIFGPSGCGKTTLLRAMAGLERVPAGTMKVGSARWQDGKQFVPIHRRAIGYVFQEPSLFPHLTVEANIQYGARRVPAEERRIQLDHAIDLLGIRTLLPRRPATLSGGERQRVALARALAMSPRLLLMDEPLASLDDDRRREILPYIASLSRELAVPVIYVSHLPDEVAQLAQQVVILKDGRVSAIGDVHTIFSDLDLPLARGPDAAAVIETTILEHDATYQLTRLGFDGGEFLVPGFDEPVGGIVRVRIAARDVSLALSSPTDSSILNRIQAKVDSLSDHASAQVTVRLLAGSTPLLARITRKSADALEITPGQPVVAQVKSVALLA